MKFYKTFSNTDVQINNLYRVSVLELRIIRWSNKALRYTKTSVCSWEYASIPRGTTTSDFWLVK